MRVFLRGLRFRTRRSTASVLPAAAFAASLLLLPAAGPCATLNVPGDYATIQAALNAAFSGDTVVVAAGTYSESDVSFGGKSILLISSAGAATTIIDGGGARPVFFVNDCEASGAVVDGFTVRNGHGVESYEGGGFTILGSACSPTTPTHLTIRNSIIRDNTTAGSGGGVKISSNCVVSIENSTIESNSAADYGGGVQIGPSDVTVSGNTITLNQAVLDGGGIKVSAEADVLIDNNTISFNTADAKGGGVSVYGSDVVVAFNDIRGNSAVTHGGGLMFEGDPAYSPTVFEAHDNLVRDNTVTGDGTSRGLGGGIHTFMDYTADTLIIADNTITGNHCENSNCSDWSGSLCCHGGALDIKSGSAEATISGNTISDNVGDLYGAALLNKQPIALSSNLIANNRANYRFGGVGFEGDDTASSTCSVTANIIRDNSTFYSTPALKDAALGISEQTSADVENNFFLENTGAKGGAIVIKDTTLCTTRIVNNTFVDNASTHSSGGTVFSDNTVFVANNIFHGDSRAFTQNGSADYTIQDNNFRDQTVALAMIGGDITSVSQLNSLADAFGNTADVEGFTDPEGSSAAGFHLADGAALQDAISCASAPAPDTDFDDQPRPQGSSCDIGADERGTAAGGAQVSALPDPVDFGSLTFPGTVTEELWIASNGTHILTIDGMSLSDMINFALDVNGGSSPCATKAPVLTPGQSCTIEVTFEPSTEGDFAEQLVLTSNDSPLAVALTGRRNDSPCNPDVNGDSEVTNADLELLARCFFEDAVPCVDVDCNGSTDAGDLAAEIEALSID